jgi:hypothetical protein
MVSQPQTVANVILEAARVVCQRTLQTSNGRRNPHGSLLQNTIRRIDPNLDRTLARKIKARTLELYSSDVVMLSRPQQEAAFIANAASSL